jgi:RNA polymerase sigma-70 factor (ECF subfamily)
MLISRPQMALAATDAVVIRRSLKDPESFAELYDRHAAGLHRFVARRLGAQLAEDICAEAFAVAFRRRGSYDERFQDARPWLFGIAVRLIGRHRRSEVRTLRALSRAAGEAPGVESELVDDRLVAAAAGPLLAAALAELPAGQRDVLLLAAWTEMSYEEIGVALRLPVGTVRSRLNRARRRVRDALAASGNDAITGGNR